MRKIRHPWRVHPHRAEFLSEMHRASPQHESLLDATIGFSVASEHLQPGAGILANDSDSEGSIDPSTIAIVSTPSHGSVIIQSDGIIQITSDPNYVGEIRFTYTVEDSINNLSNVAGVCR